MKTNWSKEPPTYEKLGRRVRINFDVEAVERTDEDGETRKEYRGYTASFDVTASRDKRIEAVIAARYPSYGAELAALNNGGDEKDEYLAFRSRAKELVDGAKEEL